MKRIFIFLFLLLIIAGCNNSRSLDVKIDNYPEVSINRYGRALFAADPSNLKSELEQLQATYSFFLDGDLDDTMNIIQLHEFITDPLLVELAQRSQTVYPELSSLEEELSYLFGHIKYYYPDEKLPIVYTYVSGLNHQYPVRLSDSVLIISLDMYLGADEEIYEKAGIPKFRSARASKEYIAVDCSDAFARRAIPLGMDHDDFLSMIVLEGKVLYMNQALLPNVPGHRIIQYSKPELGWCEENESRLWSFVVKNELLYNTDMDAISKFMIDGPFTAIFSKDSPSRLGFWLGWQIVSSYMDKNPDVSIVDLANTTDARKIFLKSGYKPRR